MAVTPLSLPLLSFTALLSSLPLLSTFTAALLYAAPAVVACTMYDAKNDVPCVVCIVSHVREERFVLSDSSQSGSLFRFWFGPCRKRNDSYPIGVLGGYAPHCARLICGSGCARLDTGVHRVTGKRRSPRRGTAVGPPGRGTMMNLFTAAPSSCLRSRRAC